MNFLDNLNGYLQVNEAQHERNPAGCIISDHASFSPMDTRAIRTILTQNILKCRKNSHDNLSQQMATNELIRIYVDNLSAILADQLTPTDNMNTTQNLLCHEGS